MLKIDQNVLFTIINILILYWILKKFLFRPVTQVMEKRKQLIEQDFSAAREKEAQADALKQQYEGKLNHADEEARMMMEQTRQAAKAERSRILQEADCEAKAALEKNRRMLEKERKEMLSSVQDDVAKLAIEAAGRILGQKDPADTDSRMYSLFLNETDVNSDSAGQDRNSKAAAERAAKEERTAEINKMQAGEGHDNC